MDQKQNKRSLISEETISKIIERIELGEPLTKITKDKSMPSLSVFYRYMRNDEKLQNKIRQARETGCFTIIDKINEELETPQDNQHMMWVREKLAMSRWLASKLASGVFGDKIKQEVKQDTKLIIEWNIPDNENNLIQAKEIMEEVPKTPIEELSSK
jgi:hypothetical protein